MEKIDHGEQRSTNQSLSDVEGRMLVLEIVAMTSLALALENENGADSDHGRVVLRLIFEAVESRCAEAGMDEESTRTARAYAGELLNAARQSLYPTEH